MHLDSLTLMAAGSFVTAVSSVLLLGAWTQLRSPALLWWAAASLLQSLGIGFLAVGLANNNVPITAISAGINALCPVLVWAGVRRFNHRRQLVVLLLAGPLAWIAAGLLPVPGGPEVASTLASFALWVAYLAAAAGELYRGRAETLSARWPLIGFIAFHAFIFAGGIFDTLSGNFPDSTLPALSSWFSLIHFETLIYAIGTAVFMVLICKERIERRQQIVARHDSLTGAMNRGAFLEGAQRIMRRCQSDGISFSLILFDLDRFKRINDTFGHDVGDDVLRRFAETALGVLRPNDILGRYGGEEFVVVLPGATIEAAFIIAERIRHRFSEISAFLGERKLDATVSAGVASATSTTTLETIIRAADQSMYEAKRLGRNRVERAPRDSEEEIRALIRIA